MMIAEEKSVSCNQNLNNTFYSSRIDANNSSESNLDQQRTFWLAQTENTDSRANSEKKLVKKARKRRAIKREIAGNLIRNLDSSPILKQKITDSKFLNSENKLNILVSVKSPQNSLRKNLLLSINSAQTSLKENNNHKNNNHNDDNPLDDNHFKEALMCEFSSAKKTTKCCCCCCSNPNFNREKVRSFCCCVCLFVQKCTNCDESIEKMDASSVCNHSIESLSRNQNSGKSSRLSILCESFMQNSARSSIVRKTKAFFFGCFISTLVCLSFVSMTYLLRRCLNLVEFFSLKNTTHVSSSILLNYFNSTYNINETNASYLNFMLNIESTQASDQITLTCDFCYLIVWSASSLLTLAYPIYFVLYFAYFKHRTKKASFVKSISAISTDSKATLSSQQTSSLNTMHRQSSAKQMTMKEFFFNSLNVFIDARKKKKPFVDSGKHGNGSNLNQSQSKSQPESGNILKSNSAAIVSASMLVLKRKKREHILRIFFYAFLWLLTGYSYLRAIDLLYCSDLSILFSVNFSFVYMGMWIFLQQKFVPLRLLGFILSAAAIIFTYYAEGFMFNLKFLGNFCATASAAGSAVLQIIWKYHTRDKNNHQRVMLLSLVGLFCFLFFWPIIFALRLSGVESASLVGAENTFFHNNIDYFIVELGKRVTLNVIGATIFGFVYLLLLAFGSFITKEIFIQAGCIAIIPAAVVLDMKLNHVELSDLKIGAIICICIGYFFLILPEKCIKFVMKKLDSEEDLNVASSRSAKVALNSIGAVQAPSSLLSRRFKYSSSTMAANAPAHTHPSLASGGGGGAGAGNKWTKHSSISSYNNFLKK